MDDLHTKYRFASAALTWANRYLWKRLVSTIRASTYHGYLKTPLVTLLDEFDTHYGPPAHAGPITFWTERTLSQPLGDNRFTEVRFLPAGPPPPLSKSMIAVVRKSTAK